MPLVMRWRGATTLPVELDGVLPESLAGMSVADVERRPVPIGNTTATLSDLFAIEGDASDGSLVLEGDLRGVARAGQGMSFGRIEVRGDVGPHAGAGMTGGELVVSGSCGVWAGAEMRGGMLRIGGDAGDALGAAYPGSRVGMREGVILVGGSAGDDVGLAMRRGLVAVAGDVGTSAGRGLVAGTIVVGGAVGLGAGLSMKRGTIVMLRGESPGAILPSFAASGRDRPPFLAVYLKQLAAWGFPAPPVPALGWFRRYNGDLGAGGQGEIWAAET